MSDYLVITFSQNTKRVSRENFLPSFYTGSASRTVLPRSGFLGCPSQPTSSQLRVRSICCPTNRQSIVPPLQSVERLRIIVKNFLYGGWGNLAAVRAFLEQRSELELHGRIAVRVVGANDQVVFSHVFQNIGQVLVHLTGDVNTGRPAICRARGGRSSGYRKRRATCKSRAI